MLSKSRCCRNKCSIKPFFGNQRDCNIRSSNMALRSGGGDLAEGILCNVKPKFYPSAVKFKTYFITRFYLACNVCM